MTNWEKTKDPNLYHSAATMYTAGDFRIWKGKYRVFSAIWSADEWHLERVSDRKILFSAKTAKECKAYLEEVSK